MKSKKENIIRLSLFIKIILIFIIFYIVLVNIHMYTHKRLVKATRIQELQQDNINLCNYIIQDIGSPPDTLKARLLAERMDIEILIETDSLIWTTQEKIKQFDETTLPQFKNSSTTRAGFANGVRVDINKNDIRYHFIMRTRLKKWSHLLNIVGLIHLSAITLMIILVYAALRWILHPIGTLHQAVQNIKEGDLSTEITTDRRDELGELITSFNKMRIRIQEMIKARDKLLLDVSHELRSPLTRILVSLEMVEDCEEKEDLFADIREMETMVTELLESARIQSKYGGIDLQTENLSMIINEVCQKFSDQKPGIRLHSLPRKIPLLLDSERIKTLFKNIISNALKYSDPEGQPVEISVKKNDAEVTVTIQDHGHGIPEKELPFIFEPFYRVDKSRSKKTGGYGLGMSLSKKIIEAHNGTIEIKSTAGKGTTVFLRFRKN
ncbi:MAG: HAMP domain-containing sensor histidine kinase [bacterium]